VSDHEYPALTGRSGTQRGGQSGTRSGNSALPGLDQVVDLLGLGIVPASGEEQVQPAVGVGLDEFVADGRVGAALQEQADHLQMTVRDRPVQAGPPEVGRDVGAEAEVKEPAHDLGPARNYYSRLGRPDDTGLQESGH
jgi:hypothetical protein